MGVYDYEENEQVYFSGASYSDDVNVDAAGCNHTCFGTGGYIFDDFGRFVSHYGN
jgi:hypothetical protein